MVRTRLAATTALLFAATLARALAQQSEISSNQHVDRLITLPPCTVESIACSSTVDRQLGTECIDGGHPVDFHSFAGTAGQQVTIEVTSTFEDFLVLYDPGEHLVRAVDGPVLVHTLNQTGTWYVVVGSLLGDTGAYSLTIRCGDCSPDLTALCLTDSRFRVTATFLTPQGHSGDAHAVTGTSDTGLFWFFSPNNIEAIVKVVNGCAFNDRYWVFAAGLTNVQVNLTVTDTFTGETRSYGNPQGMPFAPIQDTAAFAACP